MSIITSFLKKSLFGLGVFYGVLNKRDHKVYPIIICIYQLMMPSQPNKKGDPVYPVLNMYSCPRVSRQRVNNARIPLLKYRERINANNRNKSYENDFVQGNVLRKFEERDGLIYSFKNMAKKEP